MRQAFYSNLASRKTSRTVFNPYEDDRVLTNLKLYFNYLQKNKPDSLIVGLAPGYNGCRITGIPFTSGRIIKNYEHELFDQISPQVYLSRVATENSATRLWNVLKDYEEQPVLWNVFPFHPHKTGIAKSNRDPTNTEFEEGEFYLKEVLKAFKPDRIASFGWDAYNILSELINNGKIQYIKHPSRASRIDLKEGLNELLHI